ncbi:MAG TPA: nucleoside hydrolase [Jatrophihabitans sp.]|nr:nucleoside hydrolase [Jatrophihabitans sp.]
MVRRLILDCDPGHDDAVAILLAAGTPALELVAITTVAGNQILEKTTDNALKICEIAGLEAPVAAGCSGPLAGNRLTASAIHGESGLDGPYFPPPSKQASAEHAVELMRRLLESDGPLVLVATGPLTNVATLLRKYPQVVPQIEEIVIMGGSTGRGNWTPYGEFNIVADPDAADIVFRSGVPLTMCGLNVTHQALVTPAVIEEFRAVGSGLADIVVELMTFFQQTYRSVFNMPYPPLHDPVAVARVIAGDEVVSCISRDVAIELDGRHTRGATVVDLDRVGSGTNFVQVATELRTDVFWRLVVEAVARLS